jgi:fructose-1,6-bisphosphatase/inositol monophosphatase family enzyme
MLWDVAAGIAIVEGAGGRVEVSSGSSESSLDIVADNDLIQLR